MPGSQNLRTLAAVGFIALAFCSAVGADAPTSASPDPVAPIPSSFADDEIARWILDLDSNQYLVRELATQHLVAAGSAALDRLLAAANGNRPEPADRAVWILRQLSHSSELNERQQVLERLVQVKGRPRVVVEASAALGQIEHEFAVQAIEELGGRYFPQGEDDIWGQQMWNRAVIGENWRGGDEGLKHLLQLRGVPMVIVFSGDVSADGIATLARLESLQLLQLYGTRLEDTDVAELQKKMPGVKIDYRRGALLGVRGNDGQQVAEVGFVQPDSVAAGAGIRQHDVIRKFNEKAIANFGELTAEIAKHRPGDEVSLEILRGGQTITMTIKLGRWKSPEARPAGR